MFFKHLAEIFLFFQIVSTVLSGKCPQKQVSDTCVCDNQMIRCEGNQPIDLKIIFQNLSKNLSQNEKSFQFFVLNNSGVKRLESNTFSDITFRFMTIIDAQSLETIDENALNGTSNTLEIFEMSGENNLKDMTQLFRVIETLKNLVSMTLNTKGVESLPSYAFYGLNRLQELTLINGQLSHLSDNCLHFEKKSNRSLIIDFSNNNLTDISFDRNSLLRVKRPLELDLRDNQMTVLEPRIFRPFLLSNAKNSVNMQANPINCSDCRLQWLVEDKHIFQDNVFEARCSHFVSIFELESDYYNHCV